MVLPGVLAGAMWVTHWLAPGSTVYIGVIRILLSLLSLTTVYAAFKIGERLYDQRVAVLCGVICAFWYELIYFAPRALTEVIAAHVFILGIYLAAFALDESSSRWRLFFAGMLCATALMLRVQLAPAVGILMLYSCRKSWRDRWLPMLAGTIPPILLFGAVDWITWSYPFQSLLLNFDINLLQHKAAQFGTEPFNFYLRKWSTFLGPMILFSVIGAVTVRRARILGYIVLAIVIPHSMLAHKELRFVYPALPLMLILAGLGIWECALWLAERTRWKSTWRYAFLILLLAAGTTSALDISKLNWYNRTGVFHAMEYLSHTPDACGVGIYGADWSDSGGYTYLHRDIPIFLTSVERAYTPVSSSAGDTIGRWMDFDEMSPSFNYAVAENPLPALAHGYQLVQCWQDACLYKRPGLCTTTPGYSTSELLRLMGK